MSFSPNHRCQGTEGNTKHWPDPVVCPRSSWSSTRLMVEGALLCCGLLIEVAVSGRVDLLCCLNAKVTHTAAAASTLHRYITSCGIRRSDDVRRWRETVVGAALVFLLWVSVTAHLTCNTVHVRDVPNYETFCSVCYWKQYRMTRNPGHWPLWINKGATQPLYSACNFAKCWRIFKIVSL